MKWVLLEGQSITAKHGIVAHEMVVLTQGVIHAEQIRLIVVFLVGSASPIRLIRGRIRDVRYRYKLQQLQGYWIDDGRALGQGRYRCTLGQGILLSESLKTEEPKSLVPDGKAADCAAILMAAQHVLGFAALVQEPVIGIQGFVAAEVEARAVIAVAAALGDDRHLRAAAPSQVSAGNTGIHIKFLHCVCNPEAIKRTIDLRVVDADAIQSEVV